MSVLSCRMHTVIRQIAEGRWGSIRFRAAVRGPGGGVRGRLDGMPVYFINGDPIRASGSVYSSNNKLDARNMRSFRWLRSSCRARSTGRPNIIHANDWHTALAAYGNLVKRWDEKRTRRSSMSRSITCRSWVPTSVRSWKRMACPSPIPTCRIGRASCPCRSVVGLGRDRGCLADLCQMRSCTRNLDAACRTFFREPDRQPAGAS
jgi:hypothetical protein